MRRPFIVDVTFAAFTNIGIKVGLKFKYVYYRLLSVWSSFLTSMLASLLILKNHILDIHTLLLFYLLSPLFDENVGWMIFNQ